MRSVHWRTGNQLKNFRAAYIAPWLKQSKAIAWDYVKYYTRNIPGVEYNESELRCDFPNGARYRLFGADNPDALRGLYFDKVTEDEPADMRSGFHKTVILPALADREGQCTKIGTPKGHNEFYEDYKAGLEDKDTFVRVYRASETGVLPEWELESLRKAMSDEQYRQEFECSFEAAIQGAYYGKLIEEAQAAGRICNVPYDPAFPVDVYWDLGWNDATALWFVQSERGGAHRVIRYYEASGQDMAHYARFMDGLGYKYGEIILPHDGGNKQQAFGTSPSERLRELGYPNTVQPRTDNLLGDIDAVRTTIPRCWFDEKLAAQGVECLKSYRREWDDKNKVFRDRPLHDWASNGADAFRIFSVHRDMNRMRLPTTARIRSVSPMSM